ncbi:PulJ/GspJ family protein [Desulfobacter latus]|uniref:Prepilin-type N-terminal cleavage/methylation domain-containing protein n=1 Tax=Desulfobacter latus TaxID=2292 RepID=A0A850T1P3_9BACT|nr:prepilin-type N-terminal cleavage/methylation domain-containing protein [Desulfobacter latus]NWH05633.1 prepilin-type N-terminal cleavage/methylation domain-containing protein [Desulfobacter latus]
MKVIIQNKGFTLVELLLALSIFAAVMSTLFLTFNTIVSNVNPMKNGLDNAEAAANAVRRISADLKSLCLTHEPAYVPPDNDGSVAPDRFRFVSSSTAIGSTSFSSLRFASFEHLPMGTADDDRIGIISYFAQQIPDGSVVLKRKDIAAIFYNEDDQDKTGRAPVVCERVTAFELEFIDQEGEVHSSWDSDASDVDFSTPLAVRIKLKVGTADHRDIFAATVLLPTSRQKQ